MEFGKRFNKLPECDKKYILKLVNINETDIEFLKDNSKYKSNISCKFGYSECIYKLIIEYINEKIVYTIKHKNRILKKQVDKKQAVNEMARIMTMYA